MLKKWIYINIQEQCMRCYEDEPGAHHYLWRDYGVSTAKNGAGERIHSECTPRGWHSIHSIIGLDNLENSVFVSREWTGEIYSDALARQFPNRDWILTRILRLQGLEEGVNKGGEIDSFMRYIYIHGTPDSTKLGVPGSRGCVRMHNKDIIELAKWVAIDTRILIV